jgi:hypothetical protein
VRVAWRVVPILVLLLPAAVGQLPSQQACGPFNVSGTQPSDGVPPGGSVSVSVTVANAGNLAASVNVSATLLRTPAGWRVTPGVQALNVTPGNKGTAVFTVAAERGADAKAEVDFVANADCAGPGGAPCPIAQACSQQGDKTVSVVLSVQEQGGLGFLNGLDFPLEYLVAGIVLIVVLVTGVVLFARRRSGPAGALLSCPEPLKPVKPGKGTSFPVELRNPGDKPARLTLNVGAVPEGWSAFLPLPEIQLAGREARSLWLMVRAPPSAQPGQTVDVEVSATDPARPGERARSMRVRAEVSAESAA